MGEGKAVARLGDTGSHGGTIISAASSIFVNGRPTARVDDIYACPEHGDNPIITGSTSVFDEGKPVAHVGSKTACGATITTGSPDTFVDDQFVDDQTVAQFYTEQMIAVDSNGVPISYYPYYIITAGGKVYQGRTDEEGKTPRIWTNSAEEIEAFWGEDAIVKNFA